MEGQVPPEVRIYEAPKIWKNFASEKGIKAVYLMKDKLHSSLHFDERIYLNIRDDKWRNYNKIINVKSYEETMACKFLHEVAHHLYKHRNIDFETQLKETEYDFEVAIEKLGLETILRDLDEKEAWCYVQEFRKNQPEKFIHLVEGFRNWLKKIR